MFSQNVHCRHGHQTSPAAANWLRVSFSGDEQLRPAEKLGLGVGGRRRSSATIIPENQVVRARFLGRRDQVLEVAFDCSHSRRMRIPLRRCRKK